VRLFGVVALVGWGDQVCFGFGVVLVNAMCELVKCVVYVILYRYFGLCCYMCFLCFVVMFLWGFLMIQSRVCVGC